MEEARSILSNLSTSKNTSKVYKPVFYDAKKYQQANEYLDYIEESNLYSKAKVRETTNTSDIMS
jgi:hypothetical protein